MRKHYVTPLQPSTWSVSIEHLIRSTSKLNKVTRFKGMILDQFVVCFSTNCHNPVGDRDAQTSKQLDTHDHMLT